MGAGEHYEALFRELERRHGRLDESTVSAVVGFSAGGPVSLSTIRRKNIYVTCELSLYPEQRASAEGLKFELLSHNAFDLLACRALFTAIDVEGVMGSGDPPQVRLSLFSKTEIGGEMYGIYQVAPGRSSPNGTRQR